MGSSPTPGSTIRAVAERRCIGLQNRSTPVRIRPARPIYSGVIERPQIPGFDPVYVGSNPTAAAHIQQQEEKSMSREAIEKFLEDARRYLLPTA